MATLSYLFFVPSLYVILTDKRKSDYNALHAAQAFTFWGAFIMFYLLTRSFYLFLLSYKLIGYVPFVLKSIYLVVWVYAAYCGILAWQKKQFRIPLVSNIAGKLI